MKVIDVKTHAILDVEACYGARLIEQGRAVLAPAEPAKEPEKKQEPPMAEEPTEPETEPKATKAKKKG